MRSTPGEGDQLSWDLVEIAEGTNGPSQAIWGDYLAVRPHGRQDNSLVATGFVLQGGTTVENVVPRFIHFSAGATQPPVAGNDLQEIRKCAVRIQDDVKSLIELIDRSGPRRRGSLPCVQEPRIGARDGRRTRQPALHLITSRRPD